MAGEPTRWVTSTRPRKDLASDATSHGVHEGDSAKGRISPSEATPAPVAKYKSGLSGWRNLRGGGSEEDGESHCTGLEGI
mmetsp:Transcript_9181/g.16931  ORF Transcript_9181/g.16931 Transcript_9181/m.16931 type:complete len:80 (+) Transcript_9181:751-990(+)